MFMVELVHKFIHGKGSPLGKPLGLTISRRTHLFYVCVYGTRTLPVSRPPEYDGGVYIVGDHTCWQHKNQLAHIHTELSIDGKKQLKFTARKKKHKQRLVFAMVLLRLGNVISGCCMAEACKCVCTGGLLESVYVLCYLPVFHSSF